MRQSVMQMALLYFTEVRHRSILVPWMGFFSEGETVANRIVGHVAQSGHAPVHRIQRAR